MISVESIPKSVPRIGGVPKLELAPLDYRLSSELGDMCTTGKDSDEIKLLTCDTVNTEYFDESDITGMELPLQRGVWINMEDSRPILRLRMVNVALKQAGVRLGNKPERDISMIEIPLNSELAMPEANIHIANINNMLDAGPRYMYQATFNRRVKVVGVRYESTRLK